MAKNSYRNYGNKNYSSSTKKKVRNNQTSSSDLKSFAYRLGLVSRGIKNPDSALHESYQKGLQAPPKKVKKPLF